MALGVEQQIEELVAPSLEDMGYDIVRIAIFTDEGTRVQIMIERQDGQNISVSDCEKASDVVSALLDVEDVFDKAWKLEVTSPGLDRPLVRLKDWERFAGYRVAVELVAPQDGKRKFQCVCRGVKDKDLELLLDDGQKMLVALPDIRSAHVVITDEMVREALRAAKKEAKKGKARKSHNHSGKTLH